MSKIISKLREDHGNMTTLLALIAREVDFFRAGKDPDYYLIESIITYMQEFPDRVHHPLEDMICAKLQDRDPAAMVEIGDLAKSHETLEALADQLRTALDRVLSEETLPRDMFVDAVAEYRDSLLGHINMEEANFFPPALRALSDDDWNEIERNMSAVDDPLFGGKTDDKYRALHQEIVDWSRMLEEAS